MRKTLLLCFLFQVFAIALFAQERTVSGKVSASDDGLPLPGVNVVVKGTTTGSVTDATGSYKLEVPSTGAILIFSFIGYATQEIAVGAQAVIDIGLVLDAAQLSDVVVTAFGIEREKKSVGYRLENLEGSKLQQISEADPLRGLQGKVAGVNIIGSSGVPGSSTRITLRGNRSLLGNNQPLIVVDGIPYDNTQSSTSNQLVGGGAYGSGLAGIDPNNIESLVVLPPGGGSAALYGVRAANGVIVIKTKASGSRASRKGLEIAVNSSYSMEEISGLPEYQNKYGTGTGFNFAQSNGSWGAPFPGKVPYPTITEAPYWVAFADAFPDAPATVPYRAYPNNVKDFFNTGSMFDNSVTLSGGNEKSNFTSVISNTDQTGIIPESSFKRTSISLGANTVLSNKITIGGTMTYSTRTQAGPPGGAGNAIGNGSVMTRILYLGRNWDLQGQPFEDPLTRESLFFVGGGTSTNPYWSAKYDGFETTEQRINGNFNLTYDFKDWLNLTYRIGLTHFNNTNQEWFRPGGRAAGGIGQVVDDYSSFTEIESTLMLNFNKQMATDFNLKGFIAHNVNQRTREQQSYLGTGLIDFNIIDIDNTTNVLNNGGAYSQRRLFGVLGEAQLSYKDYLFLTLNGRNDWSSTLPTSQRSFFYPAATLAFVFTDALNLQSEILSLGKLRLGWTKTGNDAPVYSLNTTYALNPQFVTQSVSFPFNGIPGTTFGGIPGVTDIVPDPNLTPEFTRTFEVGAQLQFFNNRASLDFSYYNSLTTDGIATQSYPSVSGFTGYLTNFGDVSNKGVEVGLNLTPINLSNGFVWNVNLNYTHNRNLVEKLAPGIDEIVIRNLFGGGITPVLRPGQEYGIMRGSVNDRDEDGNLLIDPANGQLIRAQNPEIIGNPNPDFIAAMTNSFSFKGLTLSALFDWRQGGDIYSYTLQGQLGRGVTRDTENREMNWVIPGVLGDPNTHQPILTSEGEKITNTIQVETNDLYFGETFATNAADEWNVFDGTVVRLREVSLGYALPKNLLSKTPFGSVAVTLTGRNLWYNSPNFPKYSKFDPETTTFGTSNATGFEYDNVPSVRRYGVNLRFTF